MVSLVEILCNVFSLSLRIRLFLFSNLVPKSSLMFNPLFLKIIFITSSFLQQLPYFFTMLVGTNPTGRKISSNRDRTSAESYSTSCKQNALKCVTINCNLSSWQSRYLASYYWVGYIYCWKSFYYCIIFLSLLVHCCLEPIAYSTLYKIIKYMLAEWTN